MAKENDGILNSDYDNSSAMKNVENVESKEVLLRTTTTTTLLLATSTPNNSAGNIINMPTTINQSSTMNNGLSGAGAGDNLTENIYSETISADTKNFNNNDNSSQQKQEQQHKQQHKEDSIIAADLTEDLDVLAGPTNRRLSSNNCGINNGLRNFGDYRNIRATTGQINLSTAEGSQTQPLAVRREENPFSFKHFLNSSTTTSSTTGTNNSSNNNCNTIENITNASPTLPLNDFTSITSNSNNASQSSKLTSSTSYQSSTGARPKVPQSTSNSSSVGGGNVQQQPSSSVSTTSMSSLLGGNVSSSSETSKMKRSPRFSSFDSQASLAEYAGGSNKDLSNNCNTNFTRDPSGILDDPGSAGVFPSQQQCDYDRLQQQQQHLHAVPRSFSNYDMDLPPNRSYNFRNSEDLSSSPGRRSSPSNNHSGRPNRLNAGQSKNILSGPPNRQNADFAAALPDFVQDHWMDPWYFNEMHLSSPPNSPKDDDLPIGMQNPPSNGRVPVEQQSDKILPDFLSDGPIGHSSNSSRLADVAAGLPDLDSPEDSPGLQLSRLRLENERLRRELDESRCALAEQTRRANELETRLDGVRNSQLTYNHILELNIGEVEKNLDQSEKRTAAAQSQISKLKQHVKQLKVEVKTLRRENESLREVGAIGGTNNSNSDRLRRPSRTQQLSRDLLRAASNAENNLRQLLNGVENLRLMAASIESMDDYYETIAADFNSPPNLSDCDDFDDYGGGSGPAL